MKEFLTRIIPRRRFLQLAALGTVTVPISLTLGCEEAKPAKITEGFDYGFAQKLLDLTNEERIQKDLPLLLQDSRLIKTAKEHAQEMAQNNFFSYESLDGSTPADRMIEAGFPSNLLFEENIIHGADFMNSERDRKNMLHPKLELVGIGCFVKKDLTRWCVVDFVGVP